MAITQVRAQIDGQWYDLIYNPDNRRYEAEITLTGTSYHQPGGYFNVTAEATNDTGATVTTDGDNLPGLRLVLRETVPPVLKMISPAEGYVTTNTPAITLTASDSTEGSGVDIATLAVLLDGAVVTDGVVSEETADGYQITCTPASPLSEGWHTVSVSISDYDGNEAELTLSYIVDTVPPVLEAREQALRLIVDVESINVTGYTNDVTGPPVGVTISNNGVDLGIVPIGADGSFDHTVPLEVGLNEINVTAADGAGLVSAIAFPVIRLITDRTQADVDALLALLNAGTDAWTTEQLDDFNRAASRGAYNHTDLNRVTLAMEYLRDHLAGLGYIARYTRTTWAETDAFTVSDGAAYLDAVARFRDVIPVPVTAPAADRPPAAGRPPALPTNLEGLTLQDANGIEAVLTAVDAALGLARRHPWHSGEIFCGEV